MNNPAATQPLDDGDVRTVVDLASHIGELREAAVTLQQMFETRSRGYFTPSEDEQVLHLWVSYHKSRAALLDLVDSIRRRVGEASRDSLGEFALAYGAALILVHAARNLRNLFGDNDLVRRKLNESYSLYGIEEGSFDAIQLSLTDPANALAIRNANEFYEDHCGLLTSMATQDQSLAAVLRVIDSFRDSTRVPTTRYLKARASETARDTRERILKGSVVRTVYAIQEWGSRLVSNLSLMPNHVPSLPNAISTQLQQMLKPGDVFITRKENAVTNYFLPGYWPHAAMYVGQHQVVESLKDGVHVRSLDSPFGNDAVTVIRPLLDETTVGKAIERAHSHVGKPYDFDFDFTRADRMVCTEVVYRSYEGLGGVQFRLTRRAGRETLSAEDLLALAISNRSFQQIAVYCPKLSPELIDDGQEMTEVLRQTMAPPETT